jgi:hypothetical protein
MPAGRSGAGDGMGLAGLDVGVADGAVDPLFAGGEAASVEARVPPHETPRESIVAAATRRRIRVGEDTVRDATRARDRTSGTGPGSTFGRVLRPLGGRAGRVWKGFPGRGGGARPNVLTTLAGHPTNVRWEC